jgi:hypothetical protein
MRHRLTRLLTVGALMLTLGTPAALLQSAAWINMLVRYSQEASSFMEAVTMTFDGQHPCPLCKAIKAGQEEQQPQEPKQVAAERELLLGLPPLLFTLQPPTTPRVTAEFESSPSFRRDRPPTPPPRLS